MKLEDLYVAIGAILIALYFLGMGLLKTASLTVHVYDTYYVLNISFISLTLLLVAIVDVTAYKIFRISFPELSSYLSIAQVICTVLFFILMLLFAFFRTFINTYSQLTILVVTFVVSQLLLFEVYFSSSKIA